jgi:uncharacterized membrane protein YhaH (DUF805 family)
LHLKGLAQFAGREARGRFWPWVGISAALYMVSFIGILALTLAGTDAANNGNPGSEIANLFFMNGVVCAIIVALLAAAVVRRLHDCNRSGAWGLLPIPNLAIGVIMMPMVAFGQIGIDDSAFFTLFFNNMVYVVLLLVLIILLAQPGTAGDNRFGPPPA